MVTAAGAVHTSFIEAIGKFCEHAAGGAVSVVGGATALVAGAHQAEFNAVYVHDDSATEQDVRQALEFVRRTELPYAFVERLGHDSRFRSVAESLGLRSADWIAPVMAATAPASVAWPSDVELFAGAQCDEAHRLLVQQGFGVPPQLVDEFMGPDLLADPAVHVVVGVVDGTPVVTGLCVHVGNAALLANIVTLRSFRGRGYGAAVTDHLVSAAFDHGAEVAILESSSEGLSLYERLGFRTVVELRRWSTPSP